MSWETGWLILSTQFSGEWGNTRKDFCSDRCLLDFITDRVARTKPSGRMQAFGLAEALAERQNPPGGFYEWAPKVE